MIVWNQLDVTIPWVHRLTRIMRSGDVHRPDRPPLLNSQWSQPVLERFDWEDESTPFYKGGMSPLGNSYLFTVCIYPVNNGYTTVLRYGPLPYVKR